MADLAGSSEEGEKREKTPRKRKHTDRKISSEDGEKGERAPRNRKHTDRTLPEYPKKP